MLTKNELMNLVNAGFSKDEIFSMFPASEEPAASSEESAPEETENVTSEEQTDDVESAIVLKEYMSQVNNLFEDMTKTLKNIQAANVNNSNFPEVANTTPEEIIGKIIAPENFRKED